MRWLARPISRRQFLHLCLKTTAATSAVFLAPRLFLPEKALAAPLDRLVFQFPANIDSTTLVLPKDIAAQWIDSLKPNTDLLKGTTISSSAFLYLQDIYSHSAQLAEFGVFAVAYHTEHWDNHGIVMRMGQRDKVFLKEKESVKWVFEVDNTITSEYEGLNRYLITGECQASRRLRRSDGRMKYYAKGLVGEKLMTSTPWHTLLVGENQIGRYFHDTDQIPEEEKANYQRMGIGQHPLVKGSEREAEFRLKAFPRGPNLYGWMLHLDPQKRGTMPEKLTSLGRFNHGASCVVFEPMEFSSSIVVGKIVIYMADYDGGEYFYKFISRHLMMADVSQIDAKMYDYREGFLNEGELFVAKWEEEGSLIWEPLAFGHPSLTKEAGFSSQVDVLIEARRAADLVGATPLNRIHSLVVDPLENELIIVFAHPQTPLHNQHLNPLFSPPNGQIVKLTTEDHTTYKASWDIFLRGGEEKIAHPDVVDCPHEITTATADKAGLLWVGGRKGEENALWVCELFGELAALTRRFAIFPRGVKVENLIAHEGLQTLFATLKQEKEIVKPWTLGGVSIPVTQDIVVSFTRSSGHYKELVP